MQEFIKDTLRAFIVPVDILDREDLDVHEKMVYVVLRSYANPNTLQAFPSYSTIAKKASISKSKAIRTVKSLVDKGVIIKKRRFTLTESKHITRESNEYEFADLRPGVVSDVHHPGVPQTPGVVSDVHHPGVPQTPGVVSDVHHPGVPQTPNIDLDLDKDQDKDMDLDQIDPEIQKAIEKTGLTNHTHDILDVYSRNSVSKEVFLSVLYRVAEKKDQVKSFRGYLTRAIRNELKSQLPSKELPNAVTNPKRISMSDEELHAKLQKAESLLRELYQNEPE